MRGQTPACRGFGPLCMQLGSGGMQPSWQLHSALAASSVCNPMEAAGLKAEERACGCVPPPSMPGPPSWPGPRAALRGCATGPQLAARPGCCCRPCRAGDAAGVSVVVDGDRGAWPATRESRLVSWANELFQQAGRGSHARLPTSTPSCTGGCLARHTRGCYCLPPAQTVRQASPIPRSHHSLGPCCSRFLAGGQSAAGPAQLSHGAGRHAGGEAAGRCPPRAPCEP